MQQIAPKKKRVRGPVTGLRLDRDLVRKAKHRALDEQTTLTDIINKAIAQYLKLPWS